MAGRKRSGSHTLRERPSKDAVSDSAENDAAQVVRNAPASSAKLKSLASHYDEDQHASYVTRLEAAVGDTHNRNIALSGRYGTGKSSVLDRFEELRKSSTLRLAISTLAPGTDGTTLTNRIQKEILKQLVYSAGPQTLRHSRFRRRGPLSNKRAIAESTLFVIVIGSLLSLLGLLPTKVATIAEQSPFARIAVWLAIFVFLVAACAALRIITHNRFVVSDVSAAGATLKLSAPTNTYFDEYLDEIVFFFDQEPIDFVLFEDLDRFDDPQIFQALRELNTLLNNTPRRRQKTARAEPLRFIYAVRDSLFERIGEKTDKQSGDAARIETVRANRTKFFDVVIPVVPFISHRTAREHLQELLDTSGIAGVDLALIQLVARHVTDMRLLLNIHNEYLVFAERLLESDKVAPALSASKLFALIAYKNFHLEDFEKIPRRTSDLDSLYDLHVELVSTSVQSRQRTKRELLAKNAHPPAIAPLALSLGRRLLAQAEVEKSRANYASHQVYFTVGSEEYDSDQVTNPPFWDAVIENHAVSIGMRTSRQSAGTTVLSLSQELLEVLFPDALQGRWLERTDDATRKAVEQIDREVDQLRGADFHDMATETKYTLAIPLASEVDTEENSAQPANFSHLIDRSLKSELARELVRHGYIDRNFTIYAAQFYGDFSGIDVATFIVRTVQTNDIAINYQFTSPGALQSLLSETDASFTDTISAYNLQLLDYLLVEEPERADEVINHATRHFGVHAQEFFAAFFTGDGERQRLAEHLSRRGWPKVFTYLCTDEGVPADARTALVDAALLAADPARNYEITTEFIDFLRTNYFQMEAFTAPHSAEEIDNIAAMLQHAGLLVPSIEVIDLELRNRIVDDKLYELTAANLRTALDVTGEVSLDRAITRAGVYQHCLTHLGAYLDAVEADVDTDYAVRSSATLIEALEHAADEVETVERLITNASPEICLPDLRAAPATAWSYLASGHLFQPSLSNVEAYVSEIGRVDESLARLLVTSGQIHTDEDTESDNENEDPTVKKTAVAIALLNAHESITSPIHRVNLVRSLDIQEPLPPGQIAPEATELFALLIEHRIVPDDAPTFAHLNQGGWPAVGAAIAVSTNIQNFLQPNMIEGMVANLMADSAASSKLGSTVLAGLNDFVASDNAEELSAAARFAIKTNYALPVAEIARIARTTGSADLTVGALKISSAATSEIVNILNELGGKYSYLSTWEHDEFEIPNDEAHASVFRSLHEANLCKVTKKRGKPILIVRRP
ncbi:hypothetical protein ACAG24_013760 [Mycobacterium sp. pW049]|uniref:YobI family P-loop NTPase n=1 Tax=[Mycobacterium] bulgaricum TaxID=3238985 RepID=UPI00351ABCF1